MTSCCHAPCTIGLYSKKSFAADIKNGSVCCYFLSGFKPVYWCCTCSGTSPRLMRWSGRKGRINACGWIFSEVSYNTNFPFL
jgi:hypothetical protein